MLVGESGAGKSTIAHIIGGFLQAPKGTVTIDGIDICDLDIDWWASANYLCVSTSTYYERDLTRGLILWYGCK